jgi:hypothetical protein
MMRAEALSPRSEVRTDYHKRTYPSLQIWSEGQPSPPKGLILVFLQMIQMTGWNLMTGLEILVL